MAVKRITQETFDDAVKENMDDFGSSREDAIKLFDAMEQKFKVELLEELKRQGVGLVVATHDPLCFSAVAECTLNLCDGRLNDAGPGSGELPERVTPIGRRARGTA